MAEKPLNEAVAKFQREMKKLGLGVSVSINGQEPVVLAEAPEPQKCPHPDKCGAEGCHGCVESVTSRRKS